MNKHIDLINESFIRKYQKPLEEDAKSNASMLKDEVYNLFKRKGFDLSNTYVKGYADGVVQYINDVTEAGNDYDVEEWYRDTRMNYPEDLITLKHPEIIEYPNITMWNYDYDDIIAGIEYCKENGIDPKSLTDSDFEDIVIKANDIVESLKEESDEVEDIEDDDDYDGWDRWDVDSSRDDWDSDEDYYTDNFDESLNEDYDDTDLKEAIHSINWYFHRDLKRFLEMLAYNCPVGLERGAELIVDIAEYLSDLDESLKEDYDDTIKRLEKDIKSNLDSDQGYKAYYELEKYIVDNKLDNSILYDLAGDFAYNDKLNNAVNELAKADGRMDLVSESLKEGLEFDVDKYFDRMDINEASKYYGVSVEDISDAIPEGYEDNYDFICYLAAKPEYDDDLSSNGLSDLVLVQDKYTDRVFPAQTGERWMNDATGEILYSLNVDESLKENKTDMYKVLVNGKAVWKNNAERSFTRKEAEDYVKWHEKNDAKTGKSNQYEIKQSYSYDPADVRYHDYLQQRVGMKPKKYHNESLNESCEVTWQEFGKDDRINNKRKTFKDKEAMQNFIDKVTEKDNFYRILATRCND